jgi:hypothetical protein
MMLNFDFAYYACRARQEREAARIAVDRARDIHRTLANNYVLRAMDAVLSDMRSRGQAGDHVPAAQEQAISMGNPGLVDAWTMSVDHQRFVPSKPPSLSADGRSLRTS